MNIADLIAEAKRHIQECPDALLQTHARAALARFFKESLAWRQEVTLALVAGTPTYDLAAIADAQVCAVTALRVAATGAPVTPALAAELDSALQANWREHSAPTPSRYLHHDGPGGVRLYPRPDTDGVQLQAELALYPGVGATTIPDWVGAMFFDALVAGIVGGAQRMARKAWTDVAASTDNLLRFDAAISEASNRIAKGNTRKPTFARLPSFDDI